MQDRGGNFAYVENVVKTKKLPKNPRGFYSNLSTVTSAECTPNNDYNSSCCILWIIEFHGDGIEIFVSKPGTVFGPN